MSYQRSKAPLALMEQIIMILVFALASAVCMQAFVYSNELSKDGAKKEQASTYVQEAAELCKVYQGDFTALEEKLGGALENGTLVVSYAEENMKVVLEKQPVSGENNLFMEKAKVYAKEEDDEVIFSVEIAWQKGGQP